MSTSKSDNLYTNTLFLQVFASNLIVAALKLHVTERH